MAFPPETPFFLPPSGFNLPPTLAVPPTGFPPPVGPTPDGEDPDDDPDDDDDNPPPPPPTDVPEPGTLAILVAGIAITLLALRRRIMSRVTAKG